MQDYCKGVHNQQGLPQRRRFEIHFLTGGGGNILLVIVGWEGGGEVEADNWR